MESQLATSFGRVTDRESKRRIGRAFVGRLASGPNSLGVLGRKVGRKFVDQLASGLNPFGALESSRSARVAGLDPRYP